MADLQTEGEKIDKAKKHLKRNWHRYVLGGVVASFVGRRFLKSHIKDLKAERNQKQNENIKQKRQNQSEQSPSYIKPTTNEEKKRQIEELKNNPNKYLSK